MAGNETGMATYRLGYCSFDDLTFGSRAGQAGGRLPVDATPLPGMKVRLTPASPLLVPLVVEVSEVGGLTLARIAPGSETGTPGHLVEIDARVTLALGNGTDMPCDILRVGGVRVGLLSNTPVQPGLTYGVLRSTTVETLAALASHAGPALDATAADTVFGLGVGTRIDTPDGPQLIQDLRPGDLVTTLGNGSQPLRWSGRRHVPASAMLQVPDLRPIEFATGAIGNLRPLRVSPQHRILLNDWRAQVFFGEDEVLVPASAMVNGGTIRPVVPAEGLTYIHLLFDRHEILVADGSLSESFHPGETGLLALDDGQRTELSLLFPGPDLVRRRAAFPIVRLSEARALRLPD